jgi:hypothetical protein
MTLFEDTKPQFIAVRDTAFVINGTAHHAIRALIQKAQPIRKHFQQGRLVCYSMDGKRAHRTNTYCVFCQHNFTCQRKIRLSMILIDRPDPIPAVLDLNYPSFKAFQDLLEQVPEDTLMRTPVTLQIVADDHDHLAIAFTPD